MVSGMEPTTPAADAAVSNPATPAEASPKKGKANPPAAAPKASIGRMVTVKGPISNGADEHPAIVTRVWDPIVQDDGVKVDYVNTMVQPDAGVPYPCTWVHLFATREAAIAYRVKNPGAPAAFWPERV